MKNDYYTTTSRKVLDFIVGFFGIITVGIAWSFFGNLLSMIPGFGVFGSVYMLLIPLFSIAAVVASFVLKRRYIAIGMISAMLIPLLVFGACIIALSPMI